MVSSQDSPLGDLLPFRPLSIAPERIANFRFKIISDDFKVRCLSWKDIPFSLFNSGVGFVDDKILAALKAGFQEYSFPVASFQKVQADPKMGVKESFLEESAFPCRLHTDKNDGLHDQPRRRDVSPWPERIYEIRAFSFSKPA